jgi:hypothetical protein
MFQRKMEDGSRQGILDAFTLHIAGSSFHLIQLCYLVITPGLTECEGLFFQEGWA